LKFEPDQATMVPGAYTSLEKAGNIMKDYPDVNVVIEGHAADTGRPDFEMKLSQARAETVRDYLVKTYGINPSRIRAVGYGTSKPISSNATKEGRATNRRIEFRVE
jgi:outer membrane protein OmpA-like peptidoglycan-associated protein